MKRTYNPNKNGRIYEEDSMIAAIKDYKSRIDEGIALGELGHPESSDLTLKNVSHKINDVKYIQKPNIPRKKKKQLKKQNLYDAWLIANKRLVIDCEFLDTPSGKILKQLQDNKLDLNIGMRATGYEDSDGIVTHTKILSFDVINNPRI